MNPRQKMSFACAIVWTILGFVVSSSGRPSDMNGGQEAKVDIPSVVVPQIGVLEERPDGTSAGKDAVPIIITGPSASELSPGQSDASIGNAGKGILVPIVAVSDVESSKSGTNGNINNPLVALLPAPLPSDNQNPNLPGNPASSDLQNDEPSSDKPEIRRSITTGNDAEMMDVAEDIVFRPLFKIRQQKNSMRNFNRNYRPNYRRYNVNGYYRLPYDYFQSN